MSAPTNDEIKWAVRIQRQAAAGSAVPVAELRKANKIMARFEASR